jgi:hypothetical protein
MDTEILSERAQRVEDAFRLLQSYKDNLGNIPGILRQLVSLEVWQGYDWQGKTVTFSSFREFVEAPPPEGLGSTIEELVRLCQRYPEIAELVDKVVQEQSPSYKPPTGSSSPGLLKIHRPTSLQRNLRSLRKLALENPVAADLREKVLCGQLSANQALVQLGKKEKKFSIKPTAASVVAFAQKHLTKEQIEELIETFQGMK